MSKIKLTIEVPDEYCNGCKYLNHNFYENHHGFTTSYRCSLFKCDLGRIHQYTTNKNINKCETCRACTIKEKKKTTSSLDTEQTIFITERAREELFESVYKEEQSENFSRLYKNIKSFYDFEFSAENLERYCCGKTGLSDYAYKHISNLLKKEYIDWRKGKNENK